MVEVSRHPSTVCVLQHRGSRSSTFEATLICKYHIPVSAETGLVTTERVARLCGDHSEHAYDVLRITTHGTACLSVCCHAEAQNTLICSTHSNTIAQYDTARSACISNQPKGPKRCSNAFTPSLSHVAVYGDPAAPAIELQLCHCSKFAWLEGHTTEVRCCSISRDGSIIVSGGREGQAYVWLVTQPAGQAADPVVHRFTLPGHGTSSQVKACCISADNRWAATADTGGQVLLWDLSGLLLPDAAQKTTQPPDSGSASIHSTTDAGTAVSSVQLAAVYILPRDRTGDHATALDLSANGSWLAVGGRTGRVFVAAHAQQQLQQLPLRHQDGSKVRSCALSPDSTKLITAGDDGRMVMWDVNSSSWVLTVHEHFKPVRGCCWSPDGSKIVTAGMDTLICVMDVVLLTVHHKLRMPLRLNTGSAIATEDPAVGLHIAAGIGSQQAAGRAVAGSSPKSAATARSLLDQRHPVPRKVVACDEGNKLLACVPVPHHHKRMRSHQSTASSGVPASEAEDSVLCVDSSGRISILQPGQETATATDLAVGSVYCCSFDGVVVAAAKRDGAVTALSCAAAVTAQRQSNDGLPAAAEWDTPVAVSAKMNMLINGVSVKSQLGRVALVGTDKKAHQTGVLW